MPKLVLKVSADVPELPAPIRKEEGLTVRKVRSFSPHPESDDMVAWLLDAKFVAAHGEALRSAGLPPRSLLLWNPGGDGAPEKELPEELIFDQVLSFRSPAYFLRTLRNLFRALHLERELAEKKALLQARESENSELLQVGIALSAERDNDKLLDYILRQLRHITRADSGSLYLLERDTATGNQKLRIKIGQNDSNPQDFKEFTFPLSKKSISGYVASTGEVLNIEDAYRIPENKEYGFNTSTDKSTGYRSRSMLTVPMKDHKGEILGVVQLINRKTSIVDRITSAEDVDRFVLPFSHDLEPLVLSLASQAAVSLENNNLYREIETLFEGFVKASVQAIESRDPATSGHSGRVAGYTVDLAKAVDRIGGGKYSGTHFTDEHIKEIRYASLLHDFGKVGVREHVLVKAKKLYPDQMNLVKLRFGYIRKSMLYGLLKERFQALERDGREGYERVKAEIDSRESSLLSEIDRFLTTIVAANEPSVLAEEPTRILAEIRGKTFIEDEGGEIPFLDGDEYSKLSIRKGSLDEGERKEIESHVTHTYRFLSTIPWTKEMRNIPTIAWGHHEKLTGDGYPRGIHAEEIPIQTRMMTVSDIYDALTASDRPYKPAVSPPRALDILGAEVKDNHLDADLVKIFIESKIWERNPDTITGG